MLDLSVIIINWNAGAELLHTLEGVYHALSALSANEVILVDNASTDHSAQAAAQAFPQLKIFCNSTNVGFGAANNLGFAQARGQYVLLVNPDVQINAVALSTMLGFMEAQPQAGACGPAILNAAGTTRSAWDARRDPRPWDIFCEYAFLTRLFPRRRLFARYVLGEWDHRSNAQVEALTGACLLVRREVIQQTGGFDERFFLYGEDLDWCRRIRRAGWQVWYIATAQVQHEGARTTRQVSDRGSRWSLESYLLYFRIWGNRSELWRARLALWSGHLIRSFSWLLLSTCQPQHFSFALQRSRQYFRYAWLAWRL